MLLWLAWHWFTTRDWRAGAVWVAFIAGWLVWFQNLDRTMFLFYMAPLVPTAICRAIVTAHRGTIEALHRPGGGAIFRIRLPLDALMKRETRP